MNNNKKKIQNNLNAFTPEIKNNKETEDPILDKVKDQDFEPPARSDQPVNNPTEQAL